MTYRIIKVEAGVISRSRRLRLITLNETSIILHIINITKTESNNCFIMLERKKKWSCFFTDGKQHKACELDAITLRNRANLVPRLSILCLFCSLGERPWLRLVTCPPRIWVVNKSVGREGWQSVLIVAVTNFVGFNLEESLKTTRVSGFQVEFCRLKMPHCFCRLQNMEDFRSQGNLAVELAQTFLWLAYVKRHIPNRNETSGSVS